MQEFNNPDGATPLDPDEIEGLKLGHITTRGELDRWEQENINEAYGWLKRRRKTVSILSEQFIKTLHVQMFGKVWSWAGSFRRSNKNIGVDWITIPIELKQLLDDVRYWIGNEIYSPDEIATRFHHKLVFIHLFPNGNGRHARLITDTLLKEVFDLAPFSWGDNLRMQENGQARDDYIQALRAADNYNYSLLINFVRS